MLILLGTLCIFILTATLYSYKTAFYSSTKGRQKEPSLEFPAYQPYLDGIKQSIARLRRRPLEEVTIQSHDGLTLFGRYYHITDGAPLVICFHGYRGSYLADFHYGSNLCISHGYNVLLIDERAHGKSEGSVISFGIQERHDLVRWVQFALNRFGPDIKILLYGVSMGGATVLMGAGENLPENVKGIVSDCPYAVPEAILVEVGRNLHFPGWFTAFFSRLAARILGGFDLNETTAIKAVEKTNLPILIIHGEADTFVPASMSLQVQQANPKMIHRITIPGAAHAVSFLVEPETYERHFMDFAKQVLK